MTFVTQDPKQRRERRGKMEKGQGERADPRDLQILNRRGALRSGRARGGGGWETELWGAGLRCARKGAGDREER